MHIRSRRAVAALIVCSGLFALPAFGQTAPIPQETVAFRVNASRLVNNGPAPAVVFSTIVERTGADWIRLKFDRVTLSGVPATGDGSFLRITSMKDGAQQELNAQHLAAWNNTSAYFNGDVLVLELVAYPGTGANALTMSEIWAGIPGVQDSICGPTDDRVLSSDPRTGRLMPIGCTAWLINDPQKCFITAGHCISTSTSNAVVQFNVPLSNANGSVNNPPPQHQYPAHQPSIQSTGSGGTGNDAAYFGTVVNTTTGLTAFQAQGQAFVLSTTLPPVGQGIRITGYGTVSNPVSPTWNQVQKTHVGPFVSLIGNRLQYQADTTGGNSGSPVINEATGLAVGVHTHGGCSATAGNSGTYVSHAGLQGFLAVPKGVCIPPPPPQCYPDCNGDQILNLADFGCFQTAFASGQAYADCNGDSLFNLADFGCFQTKFATGCP